MNHITETYRRLKKATQRIGLLFKEKEYTNGLKGQVFIRAFENGKEVYNWASPNVIVNTTSVLIARLLKDSSEPQGGITYLALGTGDAGWDLQDPPAPTTNQTALETEAYRRAVDSTMFINPSDGSESTVATNIVDYAFNFSESEAVGALVELGLFGGDATETIGTGTMINYRTFPVLNKTASMAFTIIIRITS